VSFILTPLPAATIIAETIGVSSFEKFCAFYSEIIVNVHGIFEIPNSKHQIPNKSQIPNTNDLNYFDFSSIDENIFFNSFGIFQDYKVWNFEFRSL